MAAASQNPGQDAVRANSRELRRTLGAFAFPLIFYEGSTGVIRLANDAVTELTGVPVDALIGRRVAELVEHRDAAEASATGYRSGTVVSMAVRDRVLRADGTRVEVCAWARTVEVDGKLGVVALIVPVAELPRLGRDPAAPWRDLAPIAVGVVDDASRIVAISAEVDAILGTPANEWVGYSLADLIDPHDRVHLGQQDDGTPGRGGWETRMQHRDGRWIDVYVLSSPKAAHTSGARTVFALVGLSAGTPASGSERVVELESHLRRIGAEVRAAGVLDAVGMLPPAPDLPQLDELSTRQWEILSRLLQGDRVSTIAAALFISPSTVRNHLAAIFQKFGVHSQAALIQRLRQPSAPQSEQGAL